MGLRLLRIEMRHSIGLWPIFAAAYAPLPGADVFVLALMVGAVTGALGGLLLALRLRRT